MKISKNSKLVLFSLVIIAILGYVAVFVGMPTLAWGLLAVLGIGIFASLLKIVMKVIFKEDITWVASIVMTVLAGIGTGLIIQIMIAPFLGVPFL